MDREYYLHFAGHKAELEIEPIYERHRPASSSARRSTSCGSASRRPRPGTSERRARYLLELAVGGFMGEATKAAGDRARRARGDARDRGRRTQRGLPPGHDLAGERARRGSPRARSRRRAWRCSTPSSTRSTSRSRSASHELARELGWPSYRAMCEELKAVDLEALERQTRAFAEATEESYAGEARPPAASAGRGRASTRLRRSDLPYFFRARGFDPLFPDDRLMEAFERTLAGLGIDLHAQDERPARHRAAAAQEPARVLLAGAGAERGLPRDPSHRRARRLRGAVPRGRAHRALRERRSHAALRVPPPRRQLRHRGLRVPVRAPDRGRGAGCGP